MIIFLAEAAAMELLDDLLGFTSLLFFAILPMAWFFGIPLLILATLRLQAHPEIQRVDQDLPLPQEVRSFFYSAHESFDKLGFTNEGTYFLPEATPNVKAILVLFANRRRVCDAISVVFYAKANTEWNIQAKYTEVSTAFTDETAITTGNQSRPSPFPARPGCLATIHPSIPEIERLLAAHEMLVRDHARGRRPLLRLDDPFQNDVISYLRAGMLSEYAAAKDAGILNYHGTSGGGQPAPDAGPYQPPAAKVGDYYAPTFTGAYRMTWNEIFPTKQILFRRRLSRDRRLLEEAGWAG